MVKRTLSFVLVLTVLVSCLFIIQVSATEAVASTNTSGAATGSLNTDLFSEPVPSSFYSEREAMTNNEILAAEKYDKTKTNALVTTETDENGKITATVKQSGAHGTIAFAGAPKLTRISEPGTHSVEIQGSISISEYDRTTNGRVSMQWDPFLNTSDKVNYRFGEGSIYVHNNGNLYVCGASLVKEAWKGEKLDIRWRYTYTDNASNPGTKDISVQIYWKWPSDTEWTFAYDTGVVQEAVANATMRDLKLRVYSYDGTTLKSNPVTWVLEDFSVKELAFEEPAIRDLSDVLYTQYDAGKVSVDFNLPRNYKEASISIDGKDVAKFTDSSHPAGGYKSEIDLSKLDFALTHSVVFEGKMGDGTTFTKETKIASIAATEGADEVDSQLETPTTAEIANVTGTCDAFVLTGKAYVKKDLAGCYWSNHDTVSTPDGPFLSQYITELTADVDFTNAVPTLSLIAGRIAEGENYSDGFNVPIDVELPQKAFKLMVRSYTIHPETGYGDTTYAFVYADGQYIGSTVYTQTSARSMGDHYGYMTLAFGKPAGYANETIGIKNLTWNKYSAGVAKAELGATPKTVIVTFDKDMDEASAEFITLVDKEGTKVEAEVEVAGKTATITATDDIPAYASVVIGAGVKEADYEFDAYFNPIATKTRLGEALTKGYTIKLNNTPTKTEVYAMTSSKSGNTITAEIELFAPAAEEAIGSLIVVAYDENGVLQALDTQEVVAEEAGEATLTIDVPLSGDFASYKVFLWSDVSGTMIPILPVE